MSIDLYKSDAIAAAPLVEERGLSHLATVKQRIKDNALNVAVAAIGVLNGTAVNVSELTTDLATEEHLGINHDSSLPSFEKKSKTRKVARWIGAGLLGLSSLAPPIVSKVYAGDATTLPSAALSWVGITHEECPAAPESVVSATFAALDDPEDPRHSEWRERQPESNLHSLYEEADKKLEQLAAENNLTVVPRADYEEKLDKAESAEAVIAVIKNYLANFGVEFNIADSMSINEAFINVGFIDIHAGTENDRAHVLQRLKEIGGYFIQELQLMPVELVRSLGVKEAKIGRGISKMGEDPVPAFASILNGRLYLDIDEASRLQISHELGHFLNTKLCGPNGLNHDPAFKALAVTDPETKERVNHPWFEQRYATYFSPDELDELKSDFNSQIFQAGAPRGQPPHINDEFSELFSRLIYIPEGKSIMRYYQSIWDKDVYNRETGTQVVPVYWDRSK